MLGRLGRGDWVGDRYGSEPPSVIALHGWGRTGADFARILAGHDALAVHLPGFGPTAPPPVAWSTRDYADHLASALEGMEPVVVVGHSFGGRVAIRLAAAHPERVRALVLTGVPLTRSAPARRPALAFRLGRALNRFGLLPDSAMEALRQRYGSSDYRAAQGVMREILVKAVGEDYLDDASRVNCPVVMVWGERDAPAPVEAARRSLEFFPHATLRVVSGASHLLEGSLEEGVAQALSELTRP
jgi:pimeloyl-ACP methyl ester carboxylesterase